MEDFKMAAITADWLKRDRIVKVSLSLLSNLRGSIFTDPGALGSGVRRSSYIQFGKHIVGKCVHWCLMVQGGWMCELKQRGISCISSIGHPVVWGSDRHHRRKTTQRLTVWQEKVEQRECKRFSKLGVKLSVLLCLFALVGAISSHETIRETDMRIGSFSKQRFREMISTSRLPLQLPTDTHCSFNEWLYNQS